VAALEEQTVWLVGTRLCLPVLSSTQEKTGKAEEEAALLEEQSQHYKDELDKALKQIANSQSVGHILLPSFLLLSLSLPQNGSRRSRSRAQPDRGPDEVEIEDPVHSELSPVPAEHSEPTKVGASNPKPASAKEPGKHTPSHLSYPRFLTLAADKNNKKVAKKPDKGKERQKSQPVAPDNKGKRKARPDDDGTETVDSTSDKTIKSKTQKGRSTAKEPHPNAADVDSEDAVVPKKKKMRKLNVNIFASSKPDSLDWANHFNLVSWIDCQGPVP